MVVLQLLEHGSGSRPPSFPFAVPGSFAAGHPLLKVMLDLLAIPEVGFFHMFKSQSPLQPMFQD